MLDGLWPYAGSSEGVAFNSSQFVPSGSRKSARSRIFAAGMPVRLIARFEANV